MKKTTGICICMVWLSGIVQAQSHTDASGGMATGSGGNVSYSVGQIDYITVKGSNGIVSAGVQQPFEINQYTGVPEQRTDLNALLYPNPASGIVNLQLYDAIQEPMSWELTDLSGRMVGKNAITGSSTELNVGDLPNSIYYLNVTANGKRVKTLKLIVNN